jgi:hypothetical protein
MKKYKAPVKKTIKKSFYYGTFPKTLIKGNVGDIVTVVGETEKFYITTNTKNNKLPKWTVE